MSVWIFFHPLENKVEAVEENSILEAALKAGIPMDNLCGGLGRCGKCKVLVLEGECSPPTSEEKNYLSQEELRKGLRLACQARPLTHTKVWLPPTTLTQEQRLQLEGKSTYFSPDPSVKRFFIPMPSTSVRSPDNLHSYITTTLKDNHIIVKPKLDTYINDRISSLNIASQKDLSVIIRGDTILDVREKSEITPLQGVAVDLGSTKIALFHLDLESAQLLGAHGYMNPQISYGEDIISRLNYAIRNKDNLKKLQQVVIESINLNLRFLLEGKSSLREIMEITLVGNTAMHHLFLGLDVESLAFSPYVPLEERPLELSADALGIMAHPKAKVVLPPPIAGFVGSDHLAVVLATKLQEEEKPCMVIDIGTNTEVSLKSGEEIFCCSCASGPAFEGAGIKYGMRASEGAIQGVHIHPTSGEVLFSVVGGDTPRGICGSGILDAVSSMVKAGIVDPRGKLLPRHPRVIHGDDGYSFRLAPMEEKGAWVEVTQSDIQEIQKAKGAIRAGIEVLLHRAGIGYHQLNKLVIAGAFGSYLDPASARNIAMLPPISLDRVEQVGNAAGVGAREMLCSIKSRGQAYRLKESITHVELVTYPKMESFFASSMLLSEEAVQDYRRKFRLNPPGSTS